MLHDLLPKEFDVFVGTACMLERDAITPVPGSTGRTNQTVQIWHRSSNYATLQWEIDERAILATTFYVQPAFDDLADVRLLSETLLTFKISKYFSSSIAATVRYDSGPPATAVLPTDNPVKSTLAGHLLTRTGQGRRWPSTCYRSTPEVRSCPRRRRSRAARKDAQEGKSPSTQAGEFVREEIEHVREGKHGARSAKQAIAIGLSKARRAGVRLGAPKRGATSSRTRRQAKRDSAKGAEHPNPSPSPRRSRGVKRALAREGRAAASHTALSRQAKGAAKTRSTTARRASAKRAAATRKKHAKR